MRSMKGFIFTLDAVFSLVVAAVGVSILLYVGFSGSGVSQTVGSQAGLMLQSMLHGSMPQQYYRQNGAWPQLGQNESLDSRSTADPSGYLVFHWSAPSDMIPAVAVDYGVAATAAGSNAYVLNATTGNLIAAYNDGGSTITEPPALFDRILYLANSTGYVRGRGILGSSVNWSFGPNTGVDDAPEIEGRYLAFGSDSGFYLLDPINGNVVANAVIGMQSHTPALIDGEYIAATEQPGSLNQLYSYAFSGSGLVEAWNAPISTSALTIPVSTNGTIAVGSGTALHIFTLGGIPVNTTLNMPSGVLGIGAGNGYYLAQTSNDLYAFSTNGALLFYRSTVQDSLNSIISFGSRDAYLMGSNSMEAFSLSNFSQVMNISTGVYGYSGYADTALAYGNMYITGGNTLYAIGTYSVPNGFNMLDGIAYMYLHGQGSYSDALLGSTYNSTGSGIFINDTYAPDLGVSSFNSLNGSYIAQQSGITWIDNPTARLSISVWVYPTQSNGIIVDEVSQGGAWHDSVLNLFNGNVTARLWGLGCMNVGSIPENSWSNIVITWDGTNLVGYINGVKMQSETGARQVPGGGATMYYQLGQSDTTVCGLDAQFNGSMLDYQMYNSTLSPSDVAKLYQEGAIGAPTSRIKIWWPLDGNANDYSGSSVFGVTHGILFRYLKYTPSGLSNAYFIGRDSAPMYVSQGNAISEYNVSVITWK